MAERNRQFLNRLAAPWRRRRLTRRELAQLLTTLDGDNVELRLTLPGTWWKGLTVARGVLDASNVGQGVVSLADGDSERAVVLSVVRWVTGPDGDLRGPF
jgi:hypothetical protein